ncbi:MAG: hypothetical protein O2954_12440 [bacterium]|nr:hypothetical protein [bacterium]
MENKEKVRRSRLTHLALFYAMKENTQLSERIRWMVMQMDRNAVRRDREGRLCAS